MSLKLMAVLVVLITGLAFGTWWFLLRVPEGAEDSPAGQAFDVLTGLEAVEKKAQADRDLALINAKQLFKQKLLEDVDLSRGPCLSNNIIPDWVFDIAHNPREPVDDLAENQCSAYRDGTAKHFIELDPYGNLIRLQ